MSPEEENMLVKGGKLYVRACLKRRQRMIEVSRENHRRKGLL